MLFDAAARVYRERLLGIVLTGASEDGAAGLATLLACGGEAWVQDPVEAEVPRMPQAALAVAGPAAKATLSEMCRRLGDCRRFGEAGA